MAHTLFGMRGDNPFCYHRARTLAARGLRERVKLARPAPGTPFDHGIFDLIEEPLHAAWPADDAHHFTAEQVVWPEGWERWPLPEEGSPFALLRYEN